MEMRVYSLLERNTFLLWGFDPSLAYFVKK